MVYEKPKCDCGAELVWWSQPTYTDMYRITKNGKKAKRAYSHHYEGEGPEERLICSNQTCLDDYDFDFDEKDRVVRGDHWEKAFSRLR